MDSVSPFSILDRMKPGNAALQAGVAPGARAVPAAAARLDRVADTAAAGAAGTAAPGFTEILEGFAGNGARTSRGTAAAQNASAGAAQQAGPARPGAVPGFDLGTPQAARPAGAGPAPQDAAAPGTGVGEMAETVVAAGFDGLDAFARTPATQLAAGLARLAYVALRPPG